MGQCGFSSNGPATLDELVQQHMTPEVELTADQIRVMLSLVAQRLAKKEKNITIIAIGGAVNTVLLRSRQSTGDVDFFYNTKQKSADVSSVVQAAREVAHQRGLGDAWLNNHTAVFMAVSNFYCLR
jgi:predicted nucleotidyltransferase